MAINWWDDLWINESFADMMGIYPFTKFKLKDPLDTPKIDMTGVYKVDKGENTHSI